MSFNLPGHLQQHRGNRAEADREFASAKKIWTELATARGAAAEHRYHLAGLLANCPTVELRDWEQAQRLAQSLTAEVADNAAYWNCLGAASYRGGDWATASKALEHAAELRTDDPRDWLFLALNRWRAGEQAKAREAFQRGSRAFSEHVPGSLEVRRLHQEAAELLGEKAVPK